jgi:hypothetical protein
MGRFALLNVEAIIRPGVLVAGICLTMCSFGSGPNKETGVSARIESTIWSQESGIYVTVTLLFRNRTHRPAQVKRYRIVWSEGSFAGAAANLEIPAAGSREWKVRVGPASGNLRSLVEDFSAARVIVD